MKPEELSSWFEKLRGVLEAAYLQNEEPWKQSGMSGPEECWTTLRKPVADCIDKSGTFLDIGCANGFLLQCCLRWTEEKGIRIDPYGLDISSKLIEGEEMTDLEKRILPGAYPTKRIIERLTDLDFKAVQYQDGYDRVKNRKTRVAILTSKAIG